MIFFHVAAAQTDVKMSVCLTLQSVPIRYGGSLLAVTRVDTKAGISTFLAFTESSEAEKGHISLLPDKFQYLKGRMSAVCGCLWLK